MRFVQRRNYMYPVLRPGSDDYPQGSLRTNLQVGTEFAHSLPMSLRFELIEPNLRKLIREDKACCACLIECRQTLYREVVKARSGEYFIRTEIDSNQIIEKVEVHPFVIANEHLQLYTDTAHEEYEREIFLIKRGQPLVFDNIWTFSLRINSTPMRGIFDLVATDELESGQFAVDLDFSKPVVSILVERDTLLRFNEISFEEDRTIPSVYLGVVMEVLFEMRRANEVDLKGCKWAESILVSLDKKGITLQAEDDGSLFLLAQNLLENPFNLLMPSELEDDEDHEDDE